MSFNISIFEMFKIFLYHELLILVSSIDFCFFQRFIKLLEKRRKISKNKLNIPLIELKFLSRDALISRSNQNLKFIFLDFNKSCIKRRDMILFKKFCDFFGFISWNIWWIIRAKAPFIRHFNKRIDSLKFENFFFNGIPDLGKFIFFCFKSFAILKEKFKFYFT